MRPLKALISKSTINRAHVSDSPKEIKNFSYEDLLNSGNIIRAFMNDYYKFDLIVIKKENVNPLFKWILEGSDVISIGVRKLRSGWNAIFSIYPETWKRNFPISDTGVTKIQKVYSSNIDVSKIDSVDTFVKIFYEYNLQPQNVHS